MSKKSLIILIITAVVVAGVIYWIGHSSKQSIISIPSVGEENKEAANTSDWKTYRNEKYGFEMKYPVGGGVGLEWGMDQEKDKAMLSEFYFNGRYTAVLEKEGAQTITDYLDKKIGIGNYKVIGRLGDGILVGILKDSVITSVDDIDKEIRFLVKEGGVLGAGFREGSELYFADGDDYILFIWSDIEKKLFDQTEKRIFSTFKFVD